MEQLCGLVRGQYKRVSFTVYMLASYMLSVFYFFTLQDSLPVVYHRFSDGVEVARCVLEFCKV